jgi:hypothetical protein
MRIKDRSQNSIISNTVLSLLPPHTVARACIRREVHDWTLAAEEISNKDVTIEEKAIKIMAS